MPTTSLRGVTLFWLVTLDRSVKVVLGYTMGPSQILSPSSNAETTHQDTFNTNFNGSNTGSSTEIKLRLALSFTSIGTANRLYYQLFVVDANGTIQDASPPINSF